MATVTTITQTNSKNLINTGAIHVKTSATAKVKTRTELSVLLAKNLYLQFYHNSLGKTHIHRHSTCISDGAFSQHVVQNVFSENWKNLLKILMFVKRNLDNIFLTHKMCLSYVELFPFIFCYFIYRYVHACVKQIQIVRRTTN